MISAMGGYDEAGRRESPGPWLVVVVVVVLLGHASAPKASLWPFMVLAGGRRGVCGGRPRSSRTRGSTLGVGHSHVQEVARKEALGYLWPYATPCAPSSSDDGDAGRSRGCAWRPWERRGGRRKLGGGRRWWWRHAKRRGRQGVGVGGVVMVVVWWCGGEGGGGGGGDVWRCFSLLQASRATYVCANKHSGGGSCACARACAFRHSAGVISQARSPRTAAACYPPHPTTTTTTTLPQARTPSPTPNPPTASPSPPRTPAARRSPADNNNRNLRRRTASTPSPWRAGSGRRPTAPSRSRSSAQRLRACRPCSAAPASLAFHTDMPQRGHAPQSRDIRRDSVQDGAA